MNENPPRQFRAALPLVLFVTFIFLLNFLSRVSLAPLLPEIEAETGISHGQAGRLFLYLAVGNSLGLVCNGFVSRVLEHRRVIAISAMWLGTALTLAGLSETLSLFKAAFFLVGIGAGLYLPSGIATIISLVQKKDWGKVTAVHEMAPNGSFILAPLLAEAMIGFFDWRATLAGLGVAQVCAGFLFLAFGRGGRLYGQAPSPRVVGKLLGNPSFWFLTLLFTLGLCGSFGPYSMIPLYLVDMGMDRSEANQLLSLSRITAFFIPFFAGWLTDRAGVRVTILVWLGLTGAATLCLGLAGPDWIKGAVLLQPIVAVVFFPAGFTALSNVFSPEERSVAVSLIIPLAMLTGIGGFPVLTGWLGDMGRFDLSFILLGGAMLALLGAQRALPFRRLAGDAGRE